MTLLDRIEKHLKDHHISATRFGRRAAGDPRFVLDLRMGRRPRRRTVERLDAYLNQFDSDDVDLPCTTKIGGGIGRPATACIAAPHPAIVLCRPSRHPKRDDLSARR